MHSAPSVSYPVARSRTAWAACAIVWLLAAAMLLAWLAESSGWGWRQAVAAFCWLAGGTLAVGSWWHAPVGLLHWNGKCWRGPGLPGDGTLSVMLDLQRVMLVQLHGPGGTSPQWIWLERSAQPQRWADLRRAAYSRQAAEGAHGNSTGALNP